MEMEMKQRAHILAVPFLGQGHISPILQFSKRLASKGLKVTLILVSSIQNFMHKHDVGATTTTTSSVDVQCNSDGILEGENFQNVDAFIERFQAAFPQSLRKFVEEQNGDGASIKFIVYDLHMPWILDLARGLRLDAAPFFPTACAVNAIYYHLRAPVEEPVESLPSIPALGLSDLPSFVSERESSYPILRDMVLNQFTNIQKLN